MKHITYIVIIVLLSISLAFSINKNSESKEFFETNLNALNDKIKLEKNKNNDLVASKYIFKCRINDLKYFNEKLHKDIENLNVKNSKLVAALQTKGEIDFGKNDTIYEVKYDTLYKGFNYDFNFDNKWRKLSGNIDYKDDFLKFNIEKDVVTFDYTLGIDKNNRLYITSSNPYVKYEELTGFTLPKPKKYHFSFGPSIGYGYGLINNKADLYVGLSLNWNLIKF